jgi:hypothetical protein
LTGFNELFVAKFEFNPPPTPILFLKICQIILSIGKCDTLKLGVLSPPPSIWSVIISMFEIGGQLQIYILFPFLGFLHNPSSSQSFFKKGGRKVAKNNFFIERFFY